MEKLLRHWEKTLGKGEYKGIRLRIKVKDLGIGLRTFLTKSIL